MDFLLSFTSWQFAAAGAVAAAGPVLIHLLNRRRYRTVEWAAMDFLREALQRNRRMMQIRDLLLLALRTAAVLLFGLALARPFLSASEENFDNGQPLHAVILIDNSLSMAYESLDGTLLERAKDRARQFIDKLPPGSKYSIIPICGSRDGYSPDPYDTADNALEALDKIEIVDRSASVVRAVNEAKRASEAAPELSKRIVLIGDQQAGNWRDLAGPEQLKDLPAMQLVDVSPPEWENSWISDLKVPDGLADIETPTTIVVEVQHQGPTPRRDVQVTLSMGDTVIGEKTVTLDPGAKQVDFQYVFNTLSEMPEPDRPVFVPLKASIAPDRLAADDERFLAVPVVAALPVVFVDQYGSDREDPLKNRLGETRHIRAYLAPRTSRAEAARHLVKIRHVTPEELTEDILADARMVVVAGLKEPGQTVSLLRDYVKQGGQLLLAAGADFDPKAWTESAWQQGAGILPMPLADEPLGETPEAAGNDLRPFFLSFESFSGEDYFLPPNTSENELRDLYSEAFFFKAVAPVWDEETRLAWEEAERKRLTDELTFLAEAAERREVFDSKEAKGELTAVERQQRSDDDARVREIRPQWLTWANSSAHTFDTIPADPADRERLVTQRLTQTTPRVLARYSSEQGLGFLVQRKIGDGNVMFVSTGLLSSWNTLPKTNVMFLFDRILRSMTQSTLPRRNYAAIDALTLPLPSQDHDVAVVLERPMLVSPEPLDVGYIGKEQRGVTVHDLYQRGVYRVAAYRTVPASTDPQASAAPEKAVWEIPLAVNGDSDESQLAPLTREKFDEVSAGSQLRWIGAGEEISLAGTAISGQTAWWWLVLAVLVVLLVEMLILALPALRQGRNPETT